ncbi:replication protein [Bacillus massiliglaciei]|uniref:replication protein n=1 Tax=Bacillus massiliglaciei TaxID=1816693 RepID=UPI0018FEE127|nr:replication protein [Bacillus massiliglaciei]
MKNLVHENKMIIVYPQLAAKLGLKEAIILQAIHYWLERSKHHIDGRTWVYNTYQGWHEQLPFLSAETIKRTIRGLEKNGYLLSANYNRLKLDKTKWYTINYEKLHEDSTDSFPSGQAEPSDGSEELPGDSPLTPALPESTSESTSETTDRYPIESREANDAKPASESIQLLIQETFPYGLKNDWTETIQSVFHDFSHRLSLPVFRKILQDISRKAGQILCFDKYLRKSVQNALSPQKRIMRQEPVPDWMKTRETPHPPMEKSAHRSIAERREAILNQLEAWRMMKAT